MIMQWIEGRLSGQKYDTLGLQESFSISNINSIKQEVQMMINSTQFIINKIKWAETCTNHDQKSQT